MTLRKKEVMMMLSKLESSKRLSCESLFSHTINKINSERGVSLEKLVAIIDEVPEYGRRLAMYLNASRTFPYRAVVFSTVNEAAGYMSNGGVYAVVAAEELEKAVLEATVGSKIKLFWLTETKDRYRTSLLYRYGSAREIERCLAETKDTEKPIPVLGFFSPSGGCKAEELSRKIAETLGKKGKVLYISMFSFGIYGRDGGDGLSEALYFIRQSEEERGYRLQRLLQCGEYMDGIGPVRWYTDLGSITGADMEALLRRDVWETDYQAFFVAVGQFDRTGRTVLNCCDNVLVPVWETKDGKQLQEEFRRQLKESGETKLYSGMLEFAVRGGSDDVCAEAVAEAVRKGGEVIAERSGGDSQTGAGASGSVGGFHR